MKYIAMECSDIHWFDILQHCIDELNVVTRKIQSSKYLGPARDNMKKQYIHKIVNVLGSNGRAE